MIYRGRMKWIFFNCLFLLIGCSHSQTTKEVSIDEVSSENILDSLGIDLEVARNPKYGFQMVASSIKDGKLEKTISYGTDQYYYPASLVKIPAMLVLLEVLEEKGIPLDAIPVFDTVNACGSTKFVDLSRQKRISFRQMLTELIVVSDNHFYNAIYHFLTPELLNERLHELGFNGSHIYRAFTGCDLEHQLKTYPYKVYSADGKLLHQAQASELQVAVISQVYTSTQNRMFGSRHENKEGDIVDGPYDLNNHIEIPLDEMHQMLLRFLYPEEFEEQLRWKISDENREMIIGLLGAYPSEIKSAYRSLSRFDDNEYKYVNYKSSVEVRSLSKLGLSYGFASECVFVPTEGGDDGLLLTYSVYVNSNDIVNDGDYEYNEVARPFANDLFEYLLEWHLKAH